MATGRSTKFLWRAISMRNRACGCLRIIWKPEPTRRRPPRLGGPAQSTRRPLPPPSRHELRKVGPVHGFPPRGTGDTGMEWFSLNSKIPTSPSTNAGNPPSFVPIHQGIQGDTASDTAFPWLSEGAEFSMVIRRESAPVAGSGPVRDSRYPGGKAACRGNPAACLPSLRPAFPWW